TRHAEGEGGGRWTSPHESTSVCPPLLISAPCTDFTTYIFCTITLLFALSKDTHTHTSTRSLSCTTHPHKHKHKNIIFFCTIHTSSTRSLSSLSSWTPTLSKSLHSVQ